MLSIDEAIEQFKYDAECNRADLDLSYAEDNEQIAEWLEELKVLREEKSDFLIFAKDIAEANYEMGMEIGYKKAIDDAKSVILQTIDNETLVDTLHLRLEQLKEQKC